MSLLDNLDGFDQRGSVVLTRSECLALMDAPAGGRVGRIGMEMAGMPAVLPLNYVLHGDDIVLRVGPGSILGVAAHGPVVAFEVDGTIDGSGREEPEEAWSVLVRGHVSVVRDPVLLDELAASGLTPLVPEAGEVYLLVRTERVTGRRFHFGALARYAMAAAPRDDGHHGRGEESP
ncbi:MAG TPA: pyridoxamine 5'-phosphate oxidase family protein [Acidimicrobiales bacterium]|nr:pyridoxamine 5'-phosphate oxidase family protein [Acidimicrobiales bacterium]